MITYTREQLDNCIKLVLGDELGEILIKNTARPIICEIVAQNLFINKEVSSFKADVIRQALIDLEEIGEFNFQNEGE